MVESYNLYGRLNAEILQQNLQVVRSNGMQSLFKNFAQQVRNRFPIESKASGIQNLWAKSATSCASQRAAPYPWSQQIDNVNLTSN